MVIGRSFYSTPRIRLCNEQIALLLQWASIFRQEAFHRKTFCPINSNPVFKSKTHKLEEHIIESETMTPGWLTLLFSEYQKDFFRSTKATALSILALNHPSSVWHFHSCVFPAIHLIALIVLVHALVVVNPWRWSYLVMEAVKAKHTTPLSARTLPIPQHNHKTHNTQHLSLLTFNVWFSQFHFEERVNAILAILQVCNSQLQSISM